MVLIIYFVIYNLSVRGKDSEIKELLLESSKEREKIQ